MRDQVKLEVADRDFYRENPKRLVVEDNAGTGRTYFLDRRGRLLAVAVPLEDAR